MPVTGLGDDPIVNFEVSDEDKKEPLPMVQILSQIDESCDGWPRRVGTALFVDDRGQISWLESPPALFGYFGSKTMIPPSFNSGGNYHNKQEVFSEVRRTAESHIDIATLPHVPKIPGVYYAANKFDRTRAL